MVRKVKLFALLSLSVCVLFSQLASAEANIFYAVSNYTNGSAGAITKSGGDYAVLKNLVSNFGVDAAGLTFKDHNGAQRAMIREYQYGPNDTIYVWDPNDWKNPIVNRKDWASNVHAAASLGRYLYIASYESYKSGSSNQDTGEAVRIDMENGYTPDRRYRYEMFKGEAGFDSSPHGEAVEVWNDKVYVMFGVSYNGVTQYEPTEIVEFDQGLNRLRSVKLKDENGRIGKNAMRMALYGGRLYVANMGGYQGPNSWGDIWEVDLDSMTARIVLDGHDIPYVLGGESMAVGMYGIQFAPDGTAFLLAGSYSSSYMFRARLFVTTAGRLSAGDIGEPVEMYTEYSGYSWDILWDEAAETLWCMVGTSLEARDKSGRLIRSFTPSELGDNIYSISLMDWNGGSGEPSGGGSGGGGGGGGCSAGGGLAILLLLAFCVPRRHEVKERRVGEI